MTSTGRSKSRVSRRCWPRSYRRTLCARPLRSAPRTPAQASETLDGPVLRGLALLNPAVYARMSQLLAGLAGSDAPLSTIGALIESILQERKHDEPTDHRSA